MKKNKKERDIFCDMSFFMKQSGRGGCSGCIKQRECEKYYENIFRKSKKIGGNQNDYR